MLTISSSGIPIVIADGLSTPVKLAAADLQRDLRRLFDSESGFPILPHREGTAITVCTADTGKREAFTVHIDDTGVTITGSDPLGTVYGIYDFAQKELGIDPTTVFTELFPSVIRSLTLRDTHREDAPKGGRFRGWFINDEDLLTDFKLSGSKRHIDYPFYDNVMGLEVLDMVLQTALRLKLNLIIPSSFVDIMNPGEEMLVQAVCARGLYISQHHVEPLGVSHFGAVNYKIAHGLEGEISFNRDPRLMETIWTAYVRKWAAYADHVIWQLGLRGKADQAVWKQDPSVPADNESRGRIITDAIAMQHGIVCRTLGHRNFFSTTTLWLEGARLYGEGHLRLPEGTTVVFSDIGMNLMFGDDFFTTPRHPGTSYGIYYHAAFWGRGPHMAEGCDPEKMVYSYRLALEHHSLYFSILNVTNVREVHASARLNAAILWDPRGFDPEQYQKQWLQSIYGSAADVVKLGMDRYFQAYADIGAEFLRADCEKDDFFYHEYGDLPFVNYIGSDGLLRTLGRAALRGREYPVRLLEELHRSEARFSAVCRYWEELEPQIPERALPYFHRFPKLQTFYMRDMLRWVLSCDGIARFRKDPTAEDLRHDAAKHLEAILDRRRVCCEGRWENWYRGDKKIGIPALLRDTLHFEDLPLVYRERGPETQPLCTLGRTEKAAAALYGAAYTYHPNHL